MNSLSEAVAHTHSHQQIRWHSRTHRNTGMIKCRFQSSFALTMTYANVCTYLTACCSSLVRALYALFKTFHSHSTDKLLPKLPLTALLLSFEYATKNKHTIWIEFVKWKQKCLIQIETFSFYRSKHTHTHTQQFSFHLIAKSGNRRGRGKSNRK